MQATLVIWNPANLRMLLALGYSETEITDILMDHRNPVSLDAESTEGPAGITFGVLADGRSIRIFWVAECGNPLCIYPHTIHEIT